ncbi:hypothetical protein GCM10023238_38210 [Streptomyces heliomycini]
MDPAQGRRRGLATAVMPRWPAGRSDEAPRLAVDSRWPDDNAGARRLSDACGFAASHAYHHYRAPGESSRRQVTGASERATKRVCVSSAVPVPERSLELRGGRREKAAVRGDAHDCPRCA